MERTKHGSGGRGRTSIPHREVDEIVFLGNTYTLIKDNDPIEEGTFVYVDGMMRNGEYKDNENLFIFTRPDDKSPKALAFRWDGEIQGEDINGDDIRSSIDDIARLVTVTGGYLEFYNYANDVMGIDIHAGNNHFDLQVEP